MNNRDFIKEEYLTLRKEVEAAVTELALMERYCLIAVAGIYTWLLPQVLKEGLPAWSLWIPSVLVLFGALRSLTGGLHLQRLSGYIKKIELEYSKENEYATGWEHYHSELTKNKLRTKVTFMFWSVFFIVTLVVYFAAAC